MEWKIREFNELSLNELYEIMKARYEVYACEQQIFQENDFDDLDKEVIHLFLEENDKIIAYARIIKSGIKYKHATVGRVLVLKEYRGKGLATELMKKAISILKENDEKEIIISAQLYIEELYKKIGFKSISEPYDEVGIQHIEMKYEK